VQLHLNQHARFVIFGLLFLLAISFACYTRYYLIAVVPFAVLVFYAGQRNLSLIFFALLITLPLSFEYNFTSSLGTDIPDEPLMLIVAVLSTALLFQSQSVGRRTINHPLILLLLGGMGWSIISAINSTHSLLSIKFLFAKSWYILAFVIAPLIVFRDKKNIVTAAKCIVIPMVIIAGFALIRHAQFGFSFASVNRSVTPFFRNHVNYSAMLVCCIPILIGLASRSRKRIDRRILIVAVFILLAALFFSYSRGAWLALGGGAITYILVKRRLLFYGFLVLCVGTTFFLFWLRTNDNYLRFANDFKTTIYHKEFGEHIIATYKLKDISTAERFNRWVAGVRMSADRPVSGFGPGTFYEEYKPYTIPAFRTWVSDNKEHSTVHNYFILLAVEQGLPGLLFFLLLLGAMIYYAERLYHESDHRNKVIAMTLAAIIMMLVTVNFLSDLIETDKVGSIFYLCIGTLLALRRMHFMQRDR
jgi:O-antigen ligase